MVGIWIPLEIKKASKRKNEPGISASCPSVGNYMSTQVINYTTCPICLGNKLIPVFPVKDYTVSGEEFMLVECDTCHLRITQSAPTAAFIGRYYKSREYISHTESRTGFVNRLYLIARRLTLSGKSKLIKKFTGLEKGNHLDMGAGTGAFVQLMNSSGWVSIGIEPDEEARNNALELHDTTLANTDAFYKLEDQSFDAISLWHVLEHVDQLHSYLAQLIKILKPSGKLFIAVPNYTSWDAKHYIQYWAAYDVPRHLFHFSPKAMKRMIAGHGMSLRAIRPMWYDSFYISLLSEKYRYGKSNLLRGFLNGAISNAKSLGDRERCSSLIYVIEKGNQ
jgi:2-polyprenyl-3-methyl-5-hydroxy-6-metoxy-1,4-benzoquinol methylase